MLGSKIEPKTGSNMERSKNQKFHSRLGRGLIFEGQAGSKIDQKSMQKRLQDRFGFQAPKSHEKVPNIGPSWGSKSSQVASKIEVKNQSISNCKKRGPKELAKWFLASTGGNPPGHLAKAKQAQKLRMRYED